MAGQKQAQDKPLLRIVALPGMDGTGRMFQPFADAMRETIDVCSVSYPGQASDYNVLTELVAERLARETGDFILLAESFSGPVALALAQRKPPGLRALILVAALAAPPHSPLLRVAGLLPLRWFFSLPIPTWCHAKLLLGPTPLAPVQALLEDVLSSVSPATMAARMHQMRAFVLPDVLIRVPALYLRPRWDLVLPTRTYRDAARLVPDLEVRSVRGPHILLAARPHRCGELIRRFATRLEASQP